MRTRHSTQVPRPDGRLTTEVGTLTPDLNFLPKNRHVTIREHLASLGVDLDRMADQEFIALQAVLDERISHRVASDTITEHDREMVAELSIEADVRGITSGAFGEPQGHEPFNGSGPAPKNDWSSSEQYLDENPPHTVRVDHFDTPAPATYREGNRIEAGRVFTIAEQRELEEEWDGRPFDASLLSLDGTHYL